MVDRLIYFLLGGSIVHLIWSVLYHRIARDTKALLDTLGRCEDEPNSGEVLESFVGHVTAVEEDRAYFTLKVPSGEILTGRCSAAMLEKHGIVEGSRFECSTIKMGLADVRVTFRPLPSVAMTREAAEQFYESFQLELDAANFNEDY